MHCNNLPKVRVVISKAVASCDDAILTFDGQQLLTIPSGDTANIDCTTLLNAVYITSNSLGHQHTGLFVLDGVVNSKDSYVKSDDNDRIVYYDGTKWVLEKLGGGAHTHDAANGNEDYPWEADWSLEDLVVDQASISNYCSNGGVCDDVSYSIVDTDMNVLYSGSISPGGALNQTIQDSTVENSDATYQTSVLAEGLLVTPDIDLSVNSVVEGSVPSVKDIDIELEDSLSNPITPTSVTMVGDVLTIEVPSGGAVMNVDFSADKVVANAGEIIAFTDLTDNSPTHWSWRFGSEGVSLAQNPSFVFFTTGFKDITLLTGKVGAGGVEIKNSYIEILGLLLDAFPSSAGAYSLRKLRAAYTGSAIRVRRSSDNTEQDIGFNVSNGLDTTALLAFVGAGDGFVATWYDQSGAGRNAAQTTGANQPQIVSSGSVIQTNGKPAMTFSGTSCFLQFSTNFSTFNNTSIFNVAAPSTYSGAAANARFYDLYDGTRHIQYLRDSGTTRLHVKNTLWQPSNDATQFTTQNAPTAQFLSSVLALSSSNDLYFDSILQTKTATTNVGSAGTVGVIGHRADIQSTTQFIGNYQELVVYQSNQTSNIAAIEANINSYYNVF